MAIRDLYSTKEKEKPLYSNSNTANVRMQSTPQNSAWDTGQSAAPLQIDTIRKSKREKSPSELGKEVLRLMLEGEMPQVQQPAAQRSATIEPDANTAGSATDDDSVFGTVQNTEEAAVPVPTFEEVMMAAAPDLQAAGIDVNAMWAGLELGNTVNQLAEDTHIAPGMSVPVYLIERGLSGTAMGLEGAWNGMVDWARAGANADLEQQIQQAQQFAWLGEPWQRNAELIESSARSVQEALPEGAEYLRSHKAAEYAQQIEEAYDAGGFLKVAGDIVSAGGQTLPTVGINLATGGTMGLPYLFVSAEGNAAAEARAGGASEDMAFLYGLSSAGVEVATEKMFDGLPGSKGGWMDNWMADYAETDMGRAALKAAKDSVGEGFEEFASGMVQPYLAKMWNGDERDFWQTLGESTPDALYDGFLGAASSFGLSAPGNYSNIQNARIVDAALDIMDHGGTLSDAQLDMANASLQYLTNSWGEDSKWSQNADGQWRSEWNKHFGVFFPPIFGDMTQSDPVQNNATENDVPTEGANSNAEQQSGLPTEDGAKNESSNELPKFSTEKTYIDDNPATHTEEQMRRIEEYKQAVDPEIIDFIELVRESPANKKKNLPLGGVTSQQAQRIMELTGIDVTDFTHNLNSDAIRHIDKRHGFFGEADHSMANNEDIARIRYVIENADSIDFAYDENGRLRYSQAFRNSDGTRAILIQYTKALDGVCYVIQAVPDSNAKRMRVVSAYIGRKPSASRNEQVRDVQASR